MKVIFLDIDGVLSLSSDINKKTQVGDFTVPYLWNVVACKILNDILDATGAEIVLSSDWRIHYTLPKMRKIFDANGLYSRSLIGYTIITKEYQYAPSRETMGIARSHEINKWVNLHGVDNYVAIDDLPLLGLMDGKFIRTLPEDGLTKDGLSERIIELLNNK